MMSDLEGSRSLRFSTQINTIDDFVVLSENLLQLRAGTAYQEQWPWIDRIVPVEDKAEIDTVLDELLIRIVDDGNLPVDVILPSLEDADNIGSVTIHFAFPRETGLTKVRFSWDQLQVWLARNRHVPGADLLKQKMRFRLAGDKVEKPQQVRIMDTLIAEVNVSGQDYVVSDGEVLRIEKQFLQSLNERLTEQIPLSDFPFPSFQGGTEPAYLALAGERSEGRLLMLDQDKIHLPGETSFEVCDLFTDDGRLVFGKLKGKSSQFSHLCTQAETSAEMLLMHLKHETSSLPPYVDINPRPRSVTPPSTSSTP